MIAGLEPWAQQALSVGAGLVAGVLVGLERGFKLRNQKEGYRVAGIRTFSLLGLGAGIAGLISRGQPFAAGAILLGMLGYLALGAKQAGEPARQAEQGEGPDPRHPRAGRPVALGPAALDSDQQSGREGSADTKRLLAPVHAVKRSACQRT